MYRECIVYVSCIMVYRGWFLWSTCEETVGCQRDSLLTLTGPVGPPKPIQASTHQAWVAELGWLAQVDITVFANPAKGAPYRCLVWDSVQTLVPKVLPPLAGQWPLPVTQS